jgi:predicted dehydrogenase
VKEQPDDDGQLRPVTSDDDVDLQLLLADNLTARITMTAAATGEAIHQIKIIGTRGELRLNDDRLWGRRKSGQVPPDKLIDFTVEDPVVVPASLSGSLFPRGTFYLGRALKAALDHDDRAALDPAATFEDGLHVQRVISAAHRSNRTNKFIPIA